MSPHSAFWEGHYRQKEKDSHSQGHRSNFLECEAVCSHLSGEGIRCDTDSHLHVMGSIGAERLDGGFPVGLCFHPLSLCLCLCLSSFLRSLPLPLAGEGPASPLSRTGRVTHHAHGRVAQLGGEAGKLTPCEAGEPSPAGTL